MYIISQSLEGGSSKKSNRTLHITVAIVTGIMVSAGIIMGGIYLGHAITRSSYQVVKNIPCFDKIKHCVT